MMKILHARGQLFAVQDPETSPGQSLELIFFKIKNLVLGPQFGPWFEMRAGKHQI